MLEFGKVKQAKCLTVKVGENEHAIPLAKNLPIPFIKKLKHARMMPESYRGDAMTDFFIEYFGAYLGDDIEVLDMEDFTALCAAWSEASKEAGVSLGESQASPTS